MDPQPTDHPFTVHRLGSNVLQVQLMQESPPTPAQVDALRAATTAAAEGAPYALLVEKTRRDSLPLEVLQRLIEQPLLFALAFRVGGDARTFAIEALLAITAKTRSFPAEVFHTRAEALAWLALQGAELAPSVRRGMG